MKRLTFDGLFCDIAKCDSTPGGTFCETGTCTQRCVWERLKEYEDTGLEPEEIKNALDVNDIMPEINVTVDQLRNILQAEQDGRLVVLPSKTVYELTWDAGPGCDLTCPVSINGSGLCDFCDNGKLFVYERPCTQDRLKELGKTVFLTREEAEAAQKGGEG